MAKIVGGVVVFLAVAVIAVFVFVFAGTVATGGSESGAYDGVDAAGASSGQCPTTLRFGRMAARHIAAALRTEVRRAYGDMTAQGEERAWRDYSVIAIFSLDLGNSHGTPAAWRRALRRYRDAAQNLCGVPVAGRSWVVLLNFPRAIGALQGEGVAFVARTRVGWRIWATTVASELPRADLVRR